jgi:hypothetical protein
VKQGGSVDKIEVEKDFTTTLIPEINKQSNKK